MARKPEDVFRYDGEPPVAALERGVDVLMIDLRALTETQAGSLRSRIATIT